MLPLPTAPNVANQSEIRVTFAMPRAAANVTFGVRVMTNSEPPPTSSDDGGGSGGGGGGDSGLPPRGFDFSVAFSPPPQPAAALGVAATAGGSGEAKAWAVSVGQASALLPLLTTDSTIEMVLYVDHTVVECYFAGGRVALTEHVPAHLLLPFGNNTKQGVEVFASSAGAHGTPPSY